MKQDELNIEFKEFTEKLNLEEVVNIELESGFLLSFINHLLSKKPSVSDEEIKDKARERVENFINNYGLRTSETTGIMSFEVLENMLINFAQSLPPQVVQSEVSEEIEYWKSENSRLFKQLENQKETIRNYQEVVHVHFPEIYADSENLNDEIDRLKIELNILKSYHAKSLTPPDAEAVMFAEWIYKNYISNGIGKYYHNNWNGDLDTLVNYTTQELFTLYKQGGK